MRLQVNTTLALYSVLEFAADPGRHIPAAEIAAKFDVSAHHLAKVLAELARAGIVESVRGVGGGYRFAGNARRMTLMDVIQLFEDFAPPDSHRLDADGGATTRVDRALDVIVPLREILAEHLLQFRNRGVVPVDAKVDHRPDEPVDHVEARRAHRRGLASGAKPGHEPCEEALAEVFSRIALERLDHRAGHAFVGKQVAAGHAVLAVMLLVEPERLRP